MDVVLLLYVKIFDECLEAVAARIVSKEVPAETVSFPGPLDVATSSAVSAKCAGSAVASE